ncbi:MAG: serine/threonine protein kinase [Planctomycetota bacterium]|jgi:serine/threonine protein kinase
MQHSDHQSLFASFLERRRSGEDVSFESLLAENPEHATALNRCWSEHERRERELREQADEVYAASETPDLEALCLEHPELEDELRLIDQQLHIGGGLLAGLPSDIENCSIFGSEGAAPLPSVNSISAKQVVGDYRLIKLIGQGGMGQVWEAEQGSLGRRVALKLVRPDRVTPRTLELFAREARAGGRLNHRGIVTVYANGEDDDLAWIAMELVEGAWSLRNSLEEIGKLDVLPESYYRDTARFVASVADALHVAHEAGVIHRDLKPQNILISPDREPKVTDFGLARILDESAISESGGMAGTYLYMSPEQALGKREECDHLGDVFSLGVVLYEMLALRRPFEGDTSHQVSQQIIHRDPPDLRKTRSRVPPELALIVAKCLEKNPQRRYLSMAEVASDLRRFLNDKPILARPPRELRKLGLWARRNQTKSVAGSLAMLSFCVVSILLVNNMRANRQLGVTNTNLGRTVIERDGAIGDLETANEKLGSQRDELASLNADLAAERSSLQQANEKLSEQKRVVEAVADFQSEQLSSIDVRAMGMILHEGLITRAHQAGQRQGLTEEHLHASQENLKDLIEGADFTGLALSALEGSVFAGAQKALNELDQDPRVQTRLMFSLSRTLKAVGLDLRGLELLQECLRIQRSVLGDDHEESLATVQALGGTYYRLGKYAEAKPLMAEAMNSRKRLLGDLHLDSIIAACNYAHLLCGMGDLTEGVALALSSLEDLRSTLGDEDNVTLRQMHSFGLMLADNGRFRESEELLLKALETRRTLYGSENIDTIDLLGALGHLYRASGELEKAAAFCREAFEASRDLRGEEHKRSLTIMNSLGRVLRDQGNLAEAEIYIRLEVEICERNLGPENITTIRAKVGLCSLLQSQGKWQEAEELTLECIDLARRVLGADDSTTLGALSCMGSIYSSKGEYAKAEPYLREALELSRQRVGNNHPRTLAALGHWINSLIESGRLEQAESAGRELLAGSREVLGATNTHTLIAMQLLSVTLLRRGKLEESYELALELMDTASESHILQYEIEGHLILVERMVFGRDSLKDGK